MGSSSLQAVMKPQRGWGNWHARLVPADQWLHRSRGRFCTLLGGSGNVHSASSLQLIRCPTQSHDIATRYRPSLLKGLSQAAASRGPKGAAASKGQSQAASRTGPDQAAASMCGSSAEADREALQPRGVVLHNLQSTSQTGPVSALYESAPHICFVPEEDHVVADGERSDQEDDLSRGPPALEDEASPSDQPDAATMSPSRLDLQRFRVMSDGREVFSERTFLVGVELKERGPRYRLWSIQESLAELGQLADTAGLQVVGSTYQRMDSRSPRTYVGSGKVEEIRTRVQELGAETVIFDDELSPGQLRNLELALGDTVRVCDRPALILDIFSQRAQTKEGKLQVELAQLEYQLPRLTRMWSHLERQSGSGQLKGMGEKQIEVDKRLLRNRMAALKKEVDAVRAHRQQYRDRRAATPIPVVSLVGYTNTGKSTMLNRLTQAGVLAEDKLFATLDPTTRRVELPSGMECLLTDTVGFIQKLPLQLIAAFRATLEEISESSLLVHVIDASHPLAARQAAEVGQYLQDIEVGHIPVVTVLNKVDRVADVGSLEPLRRGRTVAVSALTGQGLDEFGKVLEDAIKEQLVSVEAVIPYTQGELLNSIHELGVVDAEEFLSEGALVRAHVPLSLSRRLLPLRHKMATVQESQGASRLGQ